MDTSKSAEKGGPPRRRMEWLLILLFAAAFALYLHDLEAKSLWSDEGLTLRRAEQPLGLIFKNLNLIPTEPDYHEVSSHETDGYVATPDLHPPLYFLLMHFWIRVAGQSEFALRFPSAVAATLALPLFYALGRYLLSKEAGAWAALLAAGSPYYLWYAQEARMYTWVVVLSIASLRSLLPLLEGEPRRRDYAIYIIVTAALLYTHYLGFLLLAFEILLYASYRLRTRPRGALIIIGLLIALMLPLAPYIWRTLEMRGLFAFTHRSLHLILEEACSAFSLGPGKPPTRPLWQIAPFLLLFLIGASMLAVPRRRRAWGVCLGYLFVPLLLQYAISFVRPNYMNPRHLMVISPAWEITMAQGLVTLRRRFWPGMIGLLGLALILRAQVDHQIFTAHSFWKDDIRGAVEYIEAHARPGDGIVLHHPVIRLTFDYYYDGPYPETSIPRYGNSRDKEQALARFKEWAQRYERIWFLYGPPPTFFPHDFLPGWADAHLFKLRQQKFEAWWTYVAVAAYDDGPPILDAPPSSYTEARDISWGTLHLAGFEAPETAAGQTTWLKFYWLYRRDSSALPVNTSAPEPIDLAIRLRDAEGTTWYERTLSPLPFYPPSAWPADKIVETEARLFLPEDLPPITYTLEVEPIGIGTARPVGQMRVTRPPTRELDVHPQARFEGGVELLGIELSDSVFRAGYPLLGSLTWRADADPQADYTLRVRLVDRWGRELAAATGLSLSAAGFPSSRWRKGDHVAGQFSLPLPADLKGGKYRVQLGLVDSAAGDVVPIRRWYGEREWLTVDTVRVEAWPLVTQLPAEMDHRLDDAQVAETIHLRGYDLARSEDELTVTLYWQAEAPVEANYHVFVHIGERDAPPLAQAGGVPAGWTRPTTTWRAGEIIADTHTISLRDLPPGRYDLLAGLYDPQNGQRPATVVDGEVVPGGYILLDGEWRMEDGE